jgi:hypothetical protein
MHKKLSGLLSGSISLKNFPGRESAPQSAVKQSNGTAAGYGQSLKPGKGTPSFFLRFLTGRETTRIGP